MSESWWFQHAQNTVTKCWDFSLLFPWGTYSRQRPRTWLSSTPERFQTSLPLLLPVLITLVVLLHQLTLYIEADYLAQCQSCSWPRYTVGQSGGHMASPSCGPLRLSNDCASKNMDLSPLMKMPSFQKSVHQTSIRLDSLFWAVISFTEGSFSFLHLNLKDSFSLICYLFFITGVHIFFKYSVSPKNNHILKTSNSLVCEISLPFNKMGHTAQVLEAHTPFSFVFVGHRQKLELRGMRSRGDGGWGDMLSRSKRFRVWIRDWREARSQVVWGDWRLLPEFGSVARPGCGKG